MATREDIHKLIDSLPEQAIERAHGILSHLTNAPAPAPDIEAWRQRTAERRLEMRSGIVRTPGMTGGSGGTSNYDPKRGTGQSRFSFWEGDAYVQDTLFNYIGHELTVTERIRIDGERLIYSHAVKGPGEKRDEREIIFSLA